MRKIIQKPVKSFKNLKERVDRFFKTKPVLTGHREQFFLDLPDLSEQEYRDSTPGRSVGEFIGFLSDAVPDGNIYLFGGMLRDIALMGVLGFSSDIDLVVDGSWDACVGYLELRGARKNKFGGYRLVIAGWPVDIWDAKETWAIKQGHVAYNGISSLTDTTVLNWDAILMNWRTKNIVARNGYLADLGDRRLDVVLKENPNPLGMAVRVFRHLCLKDARQITPQAAEYLSDCTGRYSYGELVASELASYRSSVIEIAIYKLFESVRVSEGADIYARLNAASGELCAQGIDLSSRQSEWKF